MEKVLRRAFDFASRSTALLVYDIPLTDEDCAHLALLAKQYARSGTESGNSSLVF